MRDALIAGLTLDTFQRHADKVAMANVAQLVNCIQTLFLAHEDRFCVTPVYHVFAMYKDHHNGQSLRASFSAPRIDYGSGDTKGSVVRLAGSASVSNGKLAVTAVNLSITEGLPAAVRLFGGGIKEARGQVLAAGDIRAHNTFAQPDAVKPQALEVKADGAELRVTMPPMSVMKLEALIV
jgi:alpha-N-arabinofuranosidase